MEMTKISSGKLCGIGYDARSRILQIELTDGTMLQYTGVGEDTWRRFKNSSSAWSFYRDNIEEEYSSRRISKSSTMGKNPLDELFK
jgi:hypothetical protein